MASVRFAPNSKETSRGVLERKLLRDTIALRDSLHQRSAFVMVESYSASTMENLLTNAYEGLMLGQRGINSVRDFLKRLSLLWVIAA
jgi:hypothetical protein